MRKGWAEKKFVDKVLKDANEALSKGRQPIALEVFPIKKVACNVEECYFE